jgi:hypothetical protein
VEAIRENEVVIKRMDERIQLLRNEVEARGSSWNEFLSAEEVAKLGAQEGEGGLVNGTTNGSGREDEEMGEGRSEAWSDGTFQTGRIVGGELRMDGGHGNGVIGSGVNGTGTANGAPVTNGGGRLDDEALRRAMEDRMRALTEEEDEGMHL